MTLWLPWRYPSAPNPWPCATCLPLRYIHTCGVVLLIVSLDCFAFYMRDRYCISGCFCFFAFHIEVNLLNLFVCLLVQPILADPADEAALEKEQASSLFVMQMPSDLK